MAQRLAEITRTRGLTDSFLHIVVNLCSNRWIELIEVTDGLGIVFNRPGQALSVPVLRSAPAAGVPDAPEPYECRLNHQCWLQSFPAPSRLRIARDSWRVLSAAFQCR